jgi:hypothetical protein
MIIACVKYNMKSEERSEFLGGVAHDCLPLALPRLLQDLEPGVLQGLLETDAFLGVILEELVDQIPGLLGDDDLVSELVGALDGVLEDFCYGVVVEGQRSGQPALNSSYMK